MYGGVAQRYILWKILGEPYKKGAAWYIKMEHPITKFPTEVRWYTDKKHADLMPQPKGEPKQFPGKIFGFENADDYILGFLQRDITSDEEDKYFRYSWRRPGEVWKFGTFMGGLWYAAKDQKVPPIGRADKCFRITWPEFVKAGQVMNHKLYGEPKGYWYSKEVTDELK